MKINSKILCIPPHISTLWTNITSLHMQGTILSISLTDGKIIEIPDLSPTHIESIFYAHAAAIENKMMEKPTPFRVGFGALDGLGMPIRHDPEQANAPDLPPEVLDRISSISKILKPDEAFLAPLVDQNCNCMFCQISRAMNGIEKELVEEQIPLEELTFQQWEIVQTNDQMYTVINKIDNKEQYNVFLGQPIGCTCGHNDCEHVLAVLKS